MSTPPAPPREPTIDEILSTIRRDIAMGTTSVEVRNASVPESRLRSVGEQARRDYLISEDAPIDLPRVLKRAAARSNSSARAVVPLRRAPERFDIGKATPAELIVLHDQATELLRPLLKAWLSENMPRLIERALALEMAQLAPGGRRNYSL